MPRVAAILFATSLLACGVPGDSQTGRQVKVVLEFQQQGQDSRQGAQGHGGVISQDGKARGRGRVALQDTTTRFSGATRGINQMTRQILGYREQQSSSESGFILTATVQ